MQCHVVFQTCLIPGHKNTVLLLGFCLGHVISACFAFAVSLGCSGWCLSRSVLLRELLGNVLIILSLIAVNISQPIAYPPATPSLVHWLRSWHGLLRCCEILQTRKSRNRKEALPKPKDLTSESLRCCLPSDPGIMCDTPTAGRPNPLCLTNLGWGSLLQSAAKLCEQSVLHLRFGTGD